jgi:hypothetical protein
MNHRGGGSGHRRCRRAQRGRRAVWWRGCDMRRGHGRSRGWWGSRRRRRRRRRRGRCGRRGGDRRSRRGVAGHRDGHRRHARRTGRVRGGRRAAGSCRDGKQREQRGGEQDAHEDRTTGGELSRACHRSDTPRTVLTFPDSGHRQLSPLTALHCAGGAGTPNRTRGPANAVSSADGTTPRVSTSCCLHAHSSGASSPLLSRASGSSSRPMTKKIAVSDSEVPRPTAVLSAPITNVSPAPANRPISSREWSRACSAQPSRGAVRRTGRCDWPLRDGGG